MEITTLFQMMVVVVISCLILGSSGSFEQLKSGNNANLTMKAAASSKQGRSVHISSSNTTLLQAASDRSQDDRVPSISFVNSDLTSGSSFDGGLGFPSHRQLNLGGQGLSPFGLSNAGIVNSLNSPYSLYSASYEKPNCLGHQPGMYGSPTYQCQVYYVCQNDGRLDAMPCAYGTKFNNYLGVCDYPQKVDNNCNPLYLESYGNPSLLSPPGVQSFQQSLSSPYNLQSNFPNTRLSSQPNIFQAPRYSPAYNNRFQG